MQNSLNVSLSKSSHFISIDLNASLDALYETIILLPYYLVVVIARMLEGSHFDDSFGQLNTHIGNHQSCAGVKYFALFGQQV